MKRYPSYKESGLLEPAEVPTHWSVHSVRYAMESVSSGGALIKGTMADEPAPGLYPAFSASGQDVWAEEARHEGPGIVLSAVGARCGKTFRADGEWTAIANTSVFIPRPGFDRDYLWYMTNMPDFWEIGGSAQPYVQVSGTLQNRTAFPPLDEQRQLAAYLDRKTAEVDTLIRKKQALIARLGELRAALIHRAVTKGLDPDVPMKDSGVEWLGEVPEHWTVPKLKYVGQVESGHTPSRQHPEYWENCTIPWFTLADVWQLRNERTTVVSETNAKVSELGLANSSARLLPAGTVILSRTASVGFSGVLGVDMATSQDFVCWICGPTIRPMYLLFALRAMKEEFRSLLMGSTHKTIYMPDAYEFVTPLPPLEGQDEIVRHIEQGTRDIDVLIDKETATVALLRELRTSLISEVVTGKVDVRAEAARLGGAAEEVAA